MKYTMRNLKVILICLSPLVCKGQEDKPQGRNIINSSMRSVIQEGNNNTVNYNLDISIEELKEILKIEKTSEILKVTSQINDLEKILPRIEAFLDSLEPDLNQIKKEDTVLYQRGRTSLTKARIAIQEIKNFQENFSVKDSVDAYGNKRYYIVKNNTIKVTKSLYTFVSDFNDGLALVKYYNKYGYVNYEGIEIIPPQYDKATVFSRNRAIVERQDLRKKYIINKFGDIIADLSSYSSASWLDSDYIKIGKNGYGNRLFRVMNPQGEILDQPDWVSTIHSAGSPHKIIIGKKSRQRKDTIFAIMDLQSQRSSGFNYSRVEKISEGYFVAKSIQERKFGLMDKEYKLVIGHIYDNLSRFDQGFARYRQGNKWGLVDPGGIQYLPPQFDEIIRWDAVEVTTKLNGLTFKFSTKGDCLNNCELFYTLLKYQHQVQGLLFISRSDSLLMTNLFGEKFQLATRNLQPVSRPILFKNLLERSRQLKYVNKFNFNKQNYYIVKEENEDSRPFYGVLDYIGNYLFRPDELKALDPISFDKSGTAIVRVQNQNYYNYEEKEISLRKIEDGNITKAIKTPSHIKAKKLAKASKEVFKQKRTSDVDGQFTIAIDLIGIIENRIDLHFRYSFPDFYASFDARTGDSQLQYYSGSGFSEVVKYSLQFGFGYQAGEDSGANGLGIGGSIIGSSVALIDESNTFERLYALGSFSLDLFYSYEPIRTIEITPYISAVYSTSGITEPFTLDDLKSYLASRTHTKKAQDFFWGIRLGYRF